MFQQNSERSMTNLTWRQTLIFLEAVGFTQHYALIVVLADMTGLAYKLKVRL